MVAPNSYIHLDLNIIIVSMCLYALVLNVKEREREVGKK